MKKITQLAYGALLVSGLAFTAVKPASADVVIGFSFGASEVGDVFGNPCYGYRHCSYPVYYQPIYIDGAWYRGPVYYREDHGRRMYWYRGNWRYDEWRGPRPPHIEWRDWRKHGPRDNKWRDAGWRKHGYDGYERDRGRDKHERDRRDRDRRDRDRRDR